MSRKLLLLMAACTITGGLSAQTIVERRVLLPIYTEDQPGALGSVWRSELWVRNESDAPIVITPSAPHDTISPEFSVQPRVARIQVGQPPGRFLRIAGAEPEGLLFNLRVQDLSRQTLTWGTELPVVEMSEFSTERIILFNVPVEDVSRTSLRIYESETQGDGVVTVKVFAQNGAAELGEASLPLPSRIPFAFNPGYGQILSLGDAFPAARGETVRIEIQPQTTGMRIWAFASVTNNETQHVTTITPQ